jgi:hypothetical protein
MKGKPKMASNYKDFADKLDAVQMTREDRDLAKNQLRSIERTLDVIWGLFGKKSTARGRKFRTPQAA